MSESNTNLLEEILDIPGIKQIWAVIYHVWGWLMIPKVIFGSPIQRLLSESGKEPTYLIPITVKQRFFAKQLNDCKIVLELIDNKNLPCVMYWYSDNIKQHRANVDLKPGAFFLVPISTREQSGDIYITDKFYIDGDSKDFKLEPRRDKYVFKLIVIDGKNRKQISPCYYSIRNKSVNSSYVFTVEIIYEGFGTEHKYVQR